MDRGTNFLGDAPRVLEEGDYPQAFTLHQKLMERGEHRPEVFYNAGLICQKRGEVRDAIVYYRKALKENPEFPEALLNLGHALKYIGAADEAGSWSVKPFPDVLKKGNSPVAASRRRACHP